jgi:hypothetical protein
MGFEWKFLYLITGILMFGFGVYSVFGGNSSSKLELAEKKLGRFEYLYLIGIVVMILGIILLRQAWIMYFGLSRSAVF